MSKKVVAVAGATGAQGGGLARAILSDSNGEFTVRALTRNRNSKKARALADLGAEVVEANVDEVSSLRRAFEGAYGAFCVTFFWEHLSPERETAQARALAQAAKDTGVEHVIWSTLEDSRKWIPLDDKGMPTLQGRYKVPHLDSKAEADVDFRKLPSTLLLTSFYFDNLIMFDMGPKRGPDGKLAFTLPIADARLATIAAEDIGKCAYGIFQRGKELIGKTAGIASEFLTGPQMAAQLTEAIGEEVGYNYVPPEIFRTLPIPAADDVANMFQFFRDFGDDLCALRSLDFSRSVNPQMQTFGDWLKDNVSRLPIEQKGFRLASSPYSDTPVHN
jgi:uncharacterized protein YbjT (DUF2867 family)